VPGKIPVIFQPSQNSKEHPSGLEKSATLENIEYSSSPNVGSDLQVV